MRRSTLSFEVMPPRVSLADGAFWDLIKRLYAFKPEFLSITYGAGGADRYTSVDSIAKIVDDTPVLPMTHLTCIDTPLNELENVANEFIKRGVRMFLALRGDVPQNAKNNDYFTKKIIEDEEEIKTTAQLTYLLRSLDKKHQRASSSAKFRNIARPLVISVAAFPGGNPALKTNQNQEIDRLLEKQDAGADFAISQLYYNPRVFDEFMNKAQKRGVTIPVIAGISPIWSISRIEKCAKYIGIDADDSYKRLLDNAWSDEERVKIGLDFWKKIAIEAVNSGAPGVHFFTFNNAENSEKLANYLGDF